ncbi:response regulator receiver sensor signal transduction histidine kinase [Pontibacter mucosus]|uniref:histidine kinase n=1 Tax=Pontibacter mucosus TaxID=1649266 RepID=A0A2T5YP90_9BACT|nr:hybrid sensor histidine kinase/response regulator [Pontibacter mucosus]PTX21131.1 response regulator receiver sensor signal transduction histidine kinase [Pontibacter mucosus]
MNIEHDLKPLTIHTNLHPVKVLLVDDKPENLVSLESLLSDEEDRITYLFANSGEEALKIALQEELALIMLDVQMPGMNGYEVARYLRNISRTRDIPIIFVTAISEQETHVIEGFEAGAVDFLFKPLHPVITKAKVAAFVRFYVQKKDLERANLEAQSLNQLLEERVEERTRELIKVNKDLDNFVYTASHDLKAPINNIEGLMTALQETLEEKQLGLDQVMPIMDMVNDAIGRFKSTLLDLTEVAKLQHQDTVAAPETVNFKELLEDVKAHIKDLIKRYDATVVDDFSAAPEMVFSRKNLRSILYNLVSNAIKYSSLDRKPEIRITTSVAGEYTLLSVRDNGLGLRKQDQEKVFTMFKRLHSHVEGTGVGLAIVKRIVENCDGKIELESELGAGTEFKIYLK